MGNGSKKLLWAAAAAAFLLALLLALAVVVPRVVDSAWLKETIRTEVAKQVKGDLDFQKAELALLPVPAVSLTQVRLAIPNTARVNLETLKVYPKFLPLLIGSIEIKNIVIDEPEFSLPLPQKQKKEQQESFSLTENLETISAKLAPLLSAIPGLKVGVHKGSMRFIAGDEQVFLFENINGAFTVDNKSLTAAISCNSNIWDSMELQSTLTPGTGAGKGSISLKNLNAKALSDYFLQSKLTITGSSFSSLEANITIRPETGFTADIISSASSFSVLHEDKEITAKVENFKGSIQFSDQISAITVDSLTLSQPRGQFSGLFKFDRSMPLASMDINARDADITSIREVLPPFVNALYGDLPALQDIYAIIRGGTILQASIHVDGKSPADLAIFESMLIKGHADKTAISLSDLGLNLQGVTGDITIAQGVLEGRNLQAELGNTTGSGGILKLGLAQNGTTPFHLDLDLNADLSEVPPLLKKLVPEKQFLEYLSLIEDLEGTGQGRLIMGESLESLNVRVEVDAINAQAKLKPIPYPITVDGGRVIHDGFKTHSIDLQGRIGKSTFSQYSSRTDFAEKEPTIEVQSGTFHLVMEEVFPWLTSYKKLADKLKAIKNISGSVDIAVKEIRGPLLKPADLHYDIEGSLQDFAIESGNLPGTLSIKSGRLKVEPDKLTFSDLQADLLESSITYSGVLQNFLSGNINAELIVTDATIGHDLNSWFVEQTILPKEYQFMTPLLISRANAKWTRGELFDLQGDFSIKNGPIFSIDIMRDPDELALRNLAIQNGDDRAIIKLDMKKRMIGAKFQGSLTKKTIDQILVYRDIDHNAWIKGDISFHFNMDSFAESAAKGSLEGGDFIIPLKNNTHIVLDSYSISASDKTLTLNSAEAVLANNSFSLNGSASLTQDHLSFDLDAKTGTIELDKIIKMFQKEDAEKGEALGEEHHIGKNWDLALGANINLLADSLLYNGYTWKPFKSRIIYAKNSFSVEVLEAQLCNISTPASLSFQDDRISLDLKMEARDQEFSEVLICLEGGEKQMTGNFNLEAHFSGQGKKDSLVNTLQGSLQYSAKNGRIYEDAQVAKLLYVLNVTNLFRGKIPDLRSTGFNYDSLVVKGEMEKGILTISPARLDAPIMEISAYGTIDIPRKNVDIQVLVAPLQSLNKLQELLPVISKIVPESLVAVPVEIKGDFDDIKVRTMNMSAISKSIFGTMVDALSTPARALEDTRAK